MRQREKSGRGRECLSFRAGASVAGLIALFIFSIFCPINAYATPPKEVKLVYDTTPHRLTVTLMHSSLFPGFHYIKQVEIKKNGASVGVNNYKSQPDKSEFSYSYDVPAARGDILEVTASCSIYGSKTVNLTVGK